MSKSSRRDFIKSKILGGFLLASGIPHFASGNILDPTSLSLDFSAAQNEDEPRDWSLIRDQFLLARRKNYLNTAGLGPATKSVVEQICSSLEYLESESVHGHQLTAPVHKTIADFLHTSPEEIALTRNATEGMNIAARSFRLKPGDEVLLTKHEHEGGAAPWLALQKEIGIKINLVDLDLSGENNLQIIKENITANTKAVSFSHVTCTTGMRLPAKEIVEYCRSKGIYSCVDGAQAIGMVPIDLSDINPDFYAGSGHKWLFGPKGTGVLFINKNILKTTSPLFAGAYSSTKFDLSTLSMEYGKTAQREEYGTRNTPLTVGLGSAVEFIAAVGIKNVAARGRELANRFRKGISDVSQIEVLSPENEEFSTSIITIKVKNREQNLINKRLRNEKTITVRTIHENNINGLRVSFAIFNSIKDVDHLVSSLKEFVAE